MKRRNTASKEAVLSLLTKAGKALSQDAIEKQLDLDVDRATIYRILSRFCDDGIAHKIIADDGKQYFSVRVEGDRRKPGLPANHFHFRCTTCQSIECLSAEVNFSIPKGYRVEGVNCILVGTCRHCS